jgi:hypothetical protein
LKSRSAAVSCHGVMCYPFGRKHGRRRGAPANKPRQKLTAAKLRRWRVSVIKKHGQYLGTVEAPNERAAEAAAVAEFDLSDEQRRRLVLRERN